MHHYIDTQDFTRKEQTLSGTFKITEFARLQQELLNPKDEINWTLQGFTHAGKRCLSLHLSGNLVLTCQRCLKPMNHQLDEYQEYYLFHTEEQAEAHDMEDPKDALVHNNQFIIFDLIEDEVILALPMMSIHEICPEEMDPEKETYQPFKASTLKKGKK
jgi:uncharacterized protein